MNLEIERKFLVKDTHIIYDSHKSVYIYQGYFDIMVPSFRIRLIDDDKAYITMKKKIKAGHYYEFEYEIPYQDGLKLYDMCKYKLEKKRYYVKEGSLLWEIDAYTNFNLVVAEVETTKKFKKPKWLGKEVTKDMSYTNLNLAKTS